jgi:F0F1-type ATP synthase assembly protein I
MPDLQAPTAPGPLQREPVTIITVLLVVVQALVLGLGIGELKDGFQAGDIGVFVTTVIGGILTRLSVFSQATVDLLANRREQQRAVKERKGR